MKKVSKSILTILALVSSSFALTGCFDDSTSTKPSTSASVVAKSDKKDDSTKKDDTTKKDTTTADTTKPDTSTTDTTTGGNTGDSTSATKVGSVYLDFDDSQGSVTADKEFGNVGDTITLTVTPLTGYKVKEVKANNTVLTGPTYSFTLLEGSNFVSVTFEADAPVVTTHNIVAPTSNDFEIVDLNATTANAGDTITFKVNVLNTNKELEFVKANGEELTATNDVYSFTMPDKDVTITVSLKEKETVTYSLSLTKDKDVLKEGDGASLFTVVLSDENVTATDWEFDTSDLANIGNISELPDDHPSKAGNTRFFTPTNAGTGTLKVSCKVNETTVSKSFKITVEADYTKYTEIATASDFINLIEKGGTITEKYYLSANIDLGGRTVNGRALESHFNGVLDGRGHCVKNFVVSNTSTSETNKANGLFYTVGGTVRNIHLIGTIADQGFSGLLCKELSGASALIENCIFEATNTYQATDWTWDRNGVIASVIQNGATVNNIVTKLDAGTTGATCFPFFAYTWSADVTINNAYTNIAHDEQYENYKPFFPQGGDDYSNYKSVNVVYTPFDSTLKSAYTSLDEDIWVLEDNKMPTLKHSGDDFVTLQPEVSATASKTTLSLKDGENETTITASIKNTDATPTYTATVNPEDVIDVTNNNDGTFKVEAKKAGTATITVKATVDGKEYSASEITITVKSADAPTYDIPEGAFEIKDAATFKQVFNGGGEYTATSFYLSADIDLTSETSLTNNGMAGEFSKIFEGQGHTIKVSYNWGLFNILGSTAEIRNVNIETDQPSEANRGAICHTNNGTIENVNVKMTLVDGKATNTFAGMCYTNAGTIKNCNVDFNVNVASNSIKSYSVTDGGTFENCTYTVNGSWDGYASAVVATTGTTLKSE